MVRWLLSCFVKVAAAYSESRGSDEYRPAGGEVLVSYVP
jgi:hypothetical protein